VLTSFAACPSLLRHFKTEALKIVTPYGLPSNVVGVGESRRMMAATAGGAAGAGTGAAGQAKDSAAAVPSSASPDGSFSTTNIQEAGVDEPDVVKSNGKIMVTVARNRLQVLDIAGASPKLVGGLNLGPNDSFGQELLLSGERLIAIGGGGYSGVSSGAMASDAPVASGKMIGGRFGAQTMVRIIDLTKPSAPHVVSTLTMEGSYISARLANGVVRLVMQSGGGGPRMAQPDYGTGDQPKQPDEAALLEANKAAIRNSKVTDWLPTYTLERDGQKPVTAPLAPCSAVLRPQKFSGLGAVSVLTVDPADPQPAHPACVLGAGGTVYASAANLYVATQEWQNFALVSGGDGPGISQPTQAPPTDLHMFSITGREPAEYVASGQVPGRVLNQFSMSELDGRLRVAVTTSQFDTGPSNGAPFNGVQTDNGVYVMQPIEGRLLPVGKITGLGHERETIQSVRFIGTRAYVVTFRQTDPLYVLDFSDPAHPVAKGELQMPGMSSYLHPLSETVLIGVGRGPDEQGGQGLQLSLFNVADPSHPVRIANQVFATMNSEAEHDHHAFTWWAATGQLILPFQSWSPQSGSERTGALVLHVDPKTGFGPVKEISQADHFQGDAKSWLASVRRSMVSDGRLLTLSEGGLRTSDLASLNELAWAAFAQGPNSQ
jgi:hypothetical protein